MYDKHMESVSYDQFLTAIDEKKIDKVNILPIPSKVKKKRLIRRKPWKMIQR